MPQLTDFWTGRRAVVLGMGASGVAAARHLAREGALLTVADTRETPAALATLRAELSGARFVTGGFAPELGDECDVLVLSPGLSPDFGAAAPVVARARVRGIPVIGEIELFARLLAALGESRGYRPKVVGITGTNGKTTTTVLTTEMLKASGFSAVAAGNIGLNALSALERAADEGTLPDAWVLELSSFQLETTSSLSLDGAALLNVTEDHIDWHGSMARYRAAKERIFRSARVRVLARGDDGVPRLLREGDLTTASKATNSCAGKRDASCRFSRKRIFSFAAGTIRSTFSRRSPSCARPGATKRRRSTGSAATGAKRTAWNSSSLPRASTSWTTPRERTWAPLSRPSKA